MRKKISIFNSLNVFRRALAVFLGVTFLFPAEAVQAFPASRPAEISQPEEKALSLTELPARLGRIEERYQGESGFAVVLIQDAHGIPEAQRSIRDLILHFRNQYGVRLAGVEGASARLDAGLIKSFPSADLVEKVSEEYMERGELTGAAAAALLDDGGMVFQGVEDWDLYQKGLGLYLAALNRESELLEKAGVRRQDLETEKSRVYSPELLEVDRALSAFEHDGAGLLEVLKICARTRTPEPGSELALILEESLSKGTNASRGQEIRALALDIKSRMNAGRITVPLSEAKKFYEAEQSFQTSLITPEAFALFLREWSESNHLSFQVPEAARQGVRDYQRLRDLEGSALLNSFERYVRSVKELLFQNEAERDLDRRSRIQSLLERMIRLEISREEWQEWKKEDGEFGAEFAKEDLAAHWFFYENADARDQVFFDHLTRGMKKMKLSSSLMIAGGFHSEGLTRMFRASGISYYKITPAISEVPSASRYRDHLRGELSWKDYFIVENGQIDLHGAFIRAFRDRLLEVSESGRAETLKKWRGRALQQLADQRLLSKAGEYTAYLDELSGVPEAAAGSNRLDRFLEGLRGLDQQGKAGSENILRLLKTTTIASLEASGLVSGARMPPVNSLIESAEARIRSELRSASGEWEWSGDIDVQAILQSVIDSIETDEIQASRPQAFRTVDFHLPIPERLRVKVRREDIQALRFRLASVARQVTAVSFWRDSLYTVLREALMNSKDGLDRTAGDIPLDLFISVEGDEIVLRLQDEGPGIHEEVFRKKLDRWNPESRYSTKEKRPLEHGAGFRAIYENARAMGAKVEIETVTPAAAGPQGFRMLLEPGARVQTLQTESTVPGTVLTMRIPFQKPAAVSPVQNDERNSSFQAYLLKENPNGAVIVHAGDFVREGLAFPVLRAKLRSALQSSKTIMIDAGSFAAVPGSSEPWKWSASAVANDDALERVEEKIRILGVQMEKAFLDFEGASLGAGKISPGIVVRELLKNAVYHGNQLDLQRLAAVRVRIEKNEITFVEAFDHGVLEPQEYRRPRVVHSSIALSGERAFLGLMEDSASGWFFEGNAEGRLVPVQKVAEGVSRVRVVRSNRSELRSASVHESMMGPLIYPRTLLNAPADSRYSQPYFFEAPVLPASPGDKALAVFEAAMREYVRIGTQHPGIAKRAKNLERRTSVLAVDLPTVFYSGGQKIGITHVLQISMRRRAILISKKFLENLDPAKAFDRKLAAFYLDAGQVLIEKYDDLQDYFRYENQNHGIVSRKLYAVYRSVEQTLSSDSSWDQEAFLGNVNFDPSDAELKYLRSLDAELRKQEKIRLLENQDQLLRNDDEIRRILSGWDPVNGYSDDEIPEVSRRVAEVVPGSINPGESMQQNALRALKRTIQSFQKRAVYFEAEGDKASAAAYFARAEELYRASLKLDFGGLFPLRVQEELIYFLLRSGNLEAFERELSRLNNVHYVPMSRRSYQVSVHQMAYPLWLISSAPDLLYKLQYYRLGGDAKRTELIERIEKTLTRAYFRELKESNDEHKKFAVDLSAVRADELKNPLLIPVPESGDVLSFVWEKMQINPRHIEVRLTASEWLNGPEEQEVVAHLDFALLEETPGRWRARTSRNRQWPVAVPGPDQFPLMISNSALAEFRGVPAVLLQLALRLARESGADDFSFRLPVSLQQKYELPYRDKKRSFRYTLNFKKLRTNELVSRELRNITARQPSAPEDNGPRSELRSEMSGETEGPPDIRLVQDAVYEAGASGRGQKTWVFQVEKKNYFSSIFEEISRFIRVSQREIKKDGLVLVVRKEPDGRYKPHGHGRVDILEPDSEMWQVPAGTLLKVIYAPRVSSPAEASDEAPGENADEVLIREAELLVLRLRPDMTSEEALETAAQLVSATDYPGRSMTPSEYYFAEALIHLIRDFIQAVLGGAAVLFMGVAAEGVSQILKELGRAGLDPGLGFLAGSVFGAFLMSAFYAPWFFLSAFHGFQGVRLYLKGGDMTPYILRRDPEVMGALVHEWVHALEYWGVIGHDYFAASAEALRRYELFGKQTENPSPELFTEDIRTSPKTRSKSWFAFFWQGQISAQKQRQFLRGYRAAQKAFEVSEEEARRIYETLDGEKLFDYRGYRFVQSLILKPLPGYMENYARAFRLGGAAAALSDRHGAGTGWRFMRALAAGRSAYEAYRGAVPRSELRSDQAAPPSYESSVSVELPEKYRQDPERHRSEAIDRSMNLKPESRTGSREREAADRKVFSVSPETEETVLKDTALRVVRYLQDKAPDVELTGLSAEIEKGVRVSGFKPFAAAVRGVSLEMQNLKVQEYLEKLALIADKLQKNARGDTVMAFAMDENEKESLETALAKILRSRGELKTHLVIPRELSQLRLPESAQKHVVPSFEGINPGQLRFAFNADAIAVITDAESAKRNFSNRRIYALRAAGLPEADLDAYHAGIVDKATRTLVALVLAEHMTRAEQLKDKTARAKMMAAVNAAFFGAASEIDEYTREQLIRFDEQGLTVDVGMIFKRLTAEAEASVHLSRSA